MDSESLSPFSHLRRRAALVWGGPVNITMPSNPGGSFFGWAQLTLEGRLIGRQLESRSVYSNVGDVDQSQAILRAVSWGEQVNRVGVASHGAAYRPLLPARFVLIPADAVRGWIAASTGIDLAIGTAQDRSWAVPIRKLRIESDYANDIFERSWQSATEPYETLNRYWSDVWEAMTKFLVNSTPATDVHEEFWPPPGEFEYDTQGYLPQAFSWQ